MTGAINCAKCYFVIETKPTMPMVVVVGVVAAAYKYIKCETEITESSFRQ